MYKMFPKTVVKFSVVLIISQNGLAAPISRPASAHTGFEKWVSRPWQSLFDGPLLQIQRKKQDAARGEFLSASAGDPWQLSTQIAKENEIPLKSNAIRGYEATVSLQKHFDTGVGLKLNTESTEANHSEKYEVKLGAELNYDLVRGGSDGLWSTARRLGESKAMQNRLQVEVETLSRNLGVFETLVDIFSLQCKRSLTSDRLSYVKQLTEVARAKSRVKVISSVNLLEMQNLDSSIRRSLIKFDNEFTDSIVRLESFGFVSNLVTAQKPQPSECLQPLLNSKFALSPTAFVTPTNSELRLVREKEKTANLTYENLENEDLPRFELFAGGRHTKDNESEASNAGLVGLRFDMTLGYEKNFWASYAAFKTKEVTQTETAIFAREQQVRAQALTRLQSTLLQSLQMLQVELEQNEKILQARKSQFQIGTIDASGLKQNIFETHAIHSDLLDTWASFEKAKFRLAQITQSSSVESKQTNEGN